MRRDDVEMGELLEYGDGDVKERATTKVYVTRQCEDAMTSQWNEDETQRISGGHDRDILVGVARKAQRSRGCADYTR